MTLTSDTTIEYVNERNGRRPPSIKCDDGNYYTLSDAAYDFFVGMEGQYGQIGYFTNPKGFRNATTWDSGDGPIELPKDRPGGAVRKAAAEPLPLDAQRPTPPHHAPLSTPPIQARSGPSEANRPAPHGWVKKGVPDAVRTLPTVREQFAMKVAEAIVGVDGNLPDVPAMTLILLNAVTAWDAAFPDGPAQVEPTKQEQGRVQVLPPKEEAPPPTEDDINDQIPF